MCKWSNLFLSKQLLACVDVEWVWDLCGRDEVCGVWGAGCVECYERFWFLSELL